MNPATVKPLLSSFYFFYYAIIGIFIPYWSLYLEKVGFNKSEIGWLVAITMIARIFAPSFWGFITDKTGKRMFWIRFALLAELCAWALFIFLPIHFVMYVVLLLVYSFFQNATVPQIESVTLFWLGDERNEYGKIRLWASIGFLLMVSGLGMLLDVVSITHLPWFLFSIAMVCCVVAFFIQEPNMAQSANQIKSTSINAIQTKKDELDASFISMLKNKPIAWFYVAQFLLLLSHAPFYGFYSNFLTDCGYSTTQIGVLWSVGLIAEIILFINSKHILQKYNQNHLVFVSLFFTAIRWILVALFPTQYWVQLFAQCLHAFSFALFQSVAMQFIFQNFAENQQGRAQAFYMTCWGLGVAIGSVVAGHFWDKTGGVFWFYSAGAMLLVFSIIFMYIRPMQHK